MSINWTEKNKTELHLNIDFKEMSYDDFSNLINEALEDATSKFIDKKIVGAEIRIKNIPSSEICEYFDMDPTDFNGWQCDWWDFFYFQDVKVNASGCAWYASVTLTIGEED